MLLPNLNNNDKKKQSHILKITRIHKNEICAFCNRPFIGILVQCYKCFSCFLLVILNKKKLFSM